MPKVQAVNLWNLSFKTRSVLVSFSNAPRWQTTRWPCYRTQGNPSPGGEGCAGACVGVCVRERVYVYVCTCECVFLPPPYRTQDNPSPGRMGGSIPAAGRKSVSQPFVFSPPTFLMAFRSMRGFRRESGRGEGTEVRPPPISPPKARGTGSRQARPWGRSSCCSRCTTSRTATTPTSSGPPC